MAGFEMVDVSFPKDVLKAIETRLYEELRNQIESHTTLHNSKIPKWRRLYRGQPSSETKSFPFPNCSNITVQLIGDRVDTLTARVLGYIFATSPLLHYSYFANTDDPMSAEKERSVLEQYMDTMGYEPTELDLYRIYGQWFTDTGKLGTSFVAANWIQNVEAMVVGYNKQRKAEFDEATIYEGPKVTKLAHEDVTMDASAQTIEDSWLVTRKIALKKHDLEQRVFDGFYTAEAVAKIEGKPDRQGPSANTLKEQRKKGVTPTQSTTNAEWDVYECYFPWFHNRKKYRLIYSFHYSSRTVMRKIFNFLPDNATPIFRAKLGYREDGAYGSGFAEMLEKYQQEATDVHNNRIDNSTLANTRFWRIDPAAVNLGSQIEIFPSSAITARKDEIEAIQMADVYQSSFQNEESVMALADARSGIAPAISGAGSGGPGKGKGSPYSAQGTLAMMQEGNHRTNLATSDFRHAHQKLGAFLTKLYGKFGTAGKEQMFGKDAKYLDQALKAFLKGKCIIPVRSTSASINKEVEKQNFMLMVGLVQRHYTAQAQLMQAITNPQIPPDAKAYLNKVLGGADRLMFHGLRGFGYDQPEDFVPDATNTIEEEKRKAQAQQQQSQPGAQPNGPQQQQDPRQAALIAAASANGGAGGAVAAPSVPSGANQGTPPQ